MSIDRLSLLEWLLPYCEPNTVCIMYPKGKRTAAYSVFRGRGACKYSVLDFAKGPAAPLTPHTSRPLHPTAWPPFSTGALAGGVRGGGAEGADRA
jgi:hypothetical protein